MNTRSILPTSASSTPLPPQPQKRAEHNPMAGLEDLFPETPIPQRKTVGGVLFLAVLSPKPVVEFDLRQFTEAMKDHKPQLEALLRLSRALLLHDYLVRTTADFNRVVEAFGNEELPYIDGAAPRPTSLTGCSPPRVPSWLAHPLPP